VLHRRPGRILQGTGDLKPLEIVRYQLAKLRTSPDRKNPSSMKPETMIRDIAVHRRFNAFA
jgi:hypothetical protein